LAGRLSLEYRETCRRRVAVRIDLGGAFCSQCALGQRLTCMWSSWPTAQRHSPACAGSSQLGPDQLRRRARCDGDTHVRTLARESHSCRDGRRGSPGAKTLGSALFACGTGQHVKRAASARIGCVGSHGGPRPPQGPGNMRARAQARLFAAKLGGALPRLLAGARGLSFTPQLAPLPHWDV
jgi:hypothetical protein